MDYQHTPGASKRNAFCWQSYEAEIKWATRSQEAAGQAKRSAIIEEKRAAGIDPLFIPGLGSAARTKPSDPGRFAVRTRWQEVGHGK